VYLVQLPQLSGNIEHLPTGLKPMATTTVKDSRRCCTEYLGAHIFMLIDGIALATSDAS
jgi:hypothetical protein